MTPYSQDLRLRVLETIQRGDGSVRQIAKRFLVSISFVTRLLQLHRTTGSVEPRPHGGGNPAVLGSEDLERLRELIRQQPDATLEECRQRLGLSCCLMTISRALSQLGLPRKKKVPRAQEQDRPDVQEQRREFCERLAGVDPKRLVFVDECGANTAMTRTYGRAPVGERVYSTTPGHWDSITLTSGMRLSGVTATLAFPGATNTDVFEAYVEQVLVPELKSGDVVIWDNLKPHQSEDAIEAVETAGAEVVPLPPWSPDLTPIEEMFSKVKGAMRSAAARTKETVYAAFGSALHDVTPENIAGWFQDRAAYAMQL
ncbi:Transposase [Singulisphaera sp. GP187]|uniref:IS630 family transposase n=1 Tax=Singulisphaera sp. GP187 TaxID=1882752 RepID=UPI00092A4659|nr:IS630 family transposase [Singulisphaera sp. GP187]SIO13504.1 Transposase [Singulisphaera sp. GP187]SIO15830.1 Transposase [Singulisphaera sp. GP187]SIO36584.1 Transposase [Singulisphaera sp. GP187]